MPFEAAHTSAAHSRSSGTGYPSSARLTHPKFEHVDVSSISIRTGSRDRVTSESLRDLADNIARFGVLQPVIVTVNGEDNFELVAGERRVRAAAIAGLRLIPAMVMCIPNSSRESVGLLENIHRQNLSQIEEARVLKRMLREMGTLGKVALAISKSKAWVSERLRLLDLSPAAAALVIDGVTSDVDVLNAISRASRLDSVRGEVLAQNVRVAERKREVARLGLDLIRRDTAQMSRSVDEEVQSKRDLGRLASEIIRIGEGGGDRAMQAREMRQILACSSTPCQDSLKTQLQQAFDIGRYASGDSALSLNLASSRLLHLILGRPMPLQLLLIRSFSLAINHSVFDFQQVAIG